jgi:hypothetical protein
MAPNTERMSASLSDAGVRRSRYSASVAMKTGVALTRDAYTAFHNLMIRRGSLWRANRALTAAGASRFVCSSGFGGFPGTIQLLGSGNPWLWYHVAASA